MVPPRGFEPLSPAPQASVLSIKLWGLVAINVPAQLCQLCQSFGLVVYHSSQKCDSLLISHFCIRTGVILAFLDVKDHPKSLRLDAVQGSNEAQTEPY